MSISVSDVLKLPSLRGARVLGGEKGLHRIVSSISVLEYAQITPVQDALYENIDFLGNELAITGFMNNPEDVELQCANIRRLAAVGEVGLILFYVGVVMKRVDSRLIDAANEADFPLICMPEGQANQRYSEVICEVMELIHRDQTASGSIVSELLEQASGLPPHQRTVDTMLRLLANRLRASVVLMDAGRYILNEAAWPMNLSEEMKRALAAAEFPAVSGRVRNEDLGVYIYRDSIQTHEQRAMDMLIFKDGDPLDVVIARQAVEVVQLAVNIWSDRHDRIAVGELVRALIQDEPLKMRRLADIFRVDVASMNSMWILSGCGAGDRERLPELVEAARASAQAHTRASIADIYDGVLVILMTGPANMQDMRSLTEAIESELRARGVRATLTRCHALNTTTRAREAFFCHQEGIAPARRIYPGRWAYTLEQIAFARQCQEKIGRGERAIEEGRIPLGDLQSEAEGASLLATLECFLLDADLSVTRTAEKLYLHKNTIKYRIQRIADRLGFVPGAFPDTMPVYTACALNRLLRQE